MATSDRLAELLREFPGIGPRQARRFVYFLLTRDPHFIRSLTETLADLKQSMRLCSNCFRFYGKNGADTPLCPICRDKSRSRAVLMIVPRDVDLENVEKSGTFNGLYFVLGGTVPILDKNPGGRVRLRELIDRVERDLQAPAGEKLAEIILGTSLNAEGENTASFIRGELKKIAGIESVRITHLGRGLSTGTELEYSDPETLKNALENRR